MHLASSVDVVVVNWNSGFHLRRCIESLDRSVLSRQSIAQVIVIDNASSDGSLEGLAIDKLPVTLTRNGSNLGFAAACNLGASIGKAEYILFLNPDVRLREDSILIPLQFMEEHSGYGVCGIQLLDDDGAVTLTCARFPSWHSFVARAFGVDRIFHVSGLSHYLSPSEHLHSRTVDQVSGSFFLVRRDLFQALGGFDERFFVYFEELDFSLRAQRAGFPSMFLSDAQAFHHGGGSSEHILGTRLYYSLRSRILYSYKHFGALGGAVVLVVTLLVEPFTRLARGAQRGSVREILATISGVVRLWGSLPGLLRETAGRPAQKAASLPSAKTDSAGLPLEGVSDAGNQAGPTRRAPELPS